MLPEWNEHGVLPPIRPGATATSADRAPYRVSLLELVERFVVSPARAAILQEFLDYRAALHTAGIIVGFQWVDGSFVEDIEELERRQPNDMDIMTFCTAPEESYGDLSGNGAAVRARHIDAYFYRLDLPLTPDRVQLIAYWYSIFAHRRNGLWKGFTEVDLNPFEDPAAQLELNDQIQKEGWTL